MEQGLRRPTFGKGVVWCMGSTVDSIATGNGSQSMNAVLSKAPGSLRVEGADPIYSIELAPGTMTASTGDTLTMDLYVNSQKSSIDLMAMHLNVPRNYFDVIDMDSGTTGLQPLADSTGAFKTPSTIAQNDTTQGTDQFIKLNYDYDYDSLTTPTRTTNMYGCRSMVMVCYTWILSLAHLGAFIPWVTQAYHTVESGIDATVICLGILTR